MKASVKSLTGVLFILLAACSTQEVKQGADVGMPATTETPAVPEDAPDMMGDLMALLRDHNLILPADLALLIKAYITLDGLGRHLNPDFNTLVFAAPYLEEIMLEIDPLQLITSYDGREYFAGKELRLVDKNGNVLYRASLPNLVFDDRLFESQGFNMFAPILNILEADENNSNWLRDYLSKTGLDSLLLPELFIGFDPVDNAGNIWKHNFNAAAKTILSFGGAPLTAPTAVPLPNSFILFALGLAGLSIIGQSRKRKFSYSVSIS